MRIGLTANGILARVSCEVPEALAMADCYGCCWHG
jgi:hypothetical protein